MIIHIIINQNFSTGKQGFVGNYLDYFIKQKFFVKTFDNSGALISS